MPRNAARARNRRKRDMPRSWIAACPAGSHTASQAAVDSAHRHATLGLRTLARDVLQRHVVTLARPVDDLAVLHEVRGRDDRLVLTAARLGLRRPPDELRAVPGVGVVEPEHAADVERKADLGLGARE